MAENGHGFDPKNVNHRTLFRQGLQNFGSPQAVQAITSLLDYVDELEQDAQRAEDEIQSLNDEIDILSEDESA